MPTKLQRIAASFHKISQHLLNSPELLAEEGIFRIPGSDENIASIIALARNHRTLKTSHLKSGYTAHDFASALKKVLRDKDGQFIKLLDPNHRMVQDFDECIKIGTAKTTLSSLINKLIETGEKNNLAVANIIHTYFYLSLKISDLSEKNKMTAENMAILLGPFLQNSILPDAYLIPTNIITMMTLLNNFCHQVLVQEQKFFEVSFEDYCQTIKKENEPEKRSLTQKAKDKFHRLFSSEKNLEQAIKVKRYASSVVNLTVPKKTSSYTTQYDIARQAQEIKLRPNIEEKLRAGTLPRSYKIKSN